MEREPTGAWSIAWRVGVAVLSAVTLGGLIFAAGSYLSPILGSFVRPVQGKGSEVSSVLGAASVALGAATIALTFIGFLVALLAIFGWRGIRDRVDAEVSRAMREERKYDKAQGRLSQGTTFGLITQYLTRIQPVLGVEDSRTFFLEDAIGFLEDALKDLRGNELEPDALNALAYSLAMRGSARDADRAWHLVQECERLHRRAGMHESFILTKGTVAATFAANLPTLSSAEITAIREAVEQVPIRESIRFREHEKNIVIRELDRALANRPNEQPPPDHRGRLRSAWEALRGR